MLEFRLAYAFVTAVVVFIVAAAPTSVAIANENDERKCELDAMLVFDASGSMGGTDWSGQVPRILHVRNALMRVLPEITPVRRVGLITYGPGPYNRCENIKLQLRPGKYSPAQIMSRVEALSPAGQTPLTSAVRQAAEELNYREKPSVIVLLTDGEETCGGKPCEIARLLEKNGRDVTVHVISYMWRATATGRGLLQSRCLAAETGGLQVTVETEEELVAALRETLGCPLITRRYFQTNKTFSLAQTTLRQAKTQQEDIDRRLPAVKSQM